MELLAVGDFIIVVGKVISFALSLLLIILVLLQKEKGGGLVGAFGGGGTISTFGVKTKDVAANITWWLFSIWLVISLSLAIASKHQGDQEVDLSNKEEITQDAATQEEALPVDDKNKD